jgi:hypothetical protein
MTTAMKKKQSGYHRQRRDGKSVLIKSLSMGGEIHRCGQEFNAYDANGNFLGWTENEAEAEYMASHGFVNNPGCDRASDLCWWSLWNDVVDSGHQVLLGSDGEQIISLDHHLFMVAVDAKGGWEIEVLTDQEMGSRYSTSEEFDCVSELKVCPKTSVFRLE